MACPYPRALIFRSVVLVLWCAEHAMHFSWRATRDAAAQIFPCTYFAVINSSFLCPYISNIHCPRMKDGAAHNAHVALLVPWNSPALRAVPRHCYAVWWGNDVGNHDALWGWGWGCALSRLSL
jgi:hypothetical protein